MNSTGNRRNMGKRGYNFFIAYAWDDGKIHACAIHDYLSKYLKRHTFFIDDQGLGEIKSIEKNLHSADCLILIVTPAIFESKAKKEYQYAIDNNIYILPCKPKDYVTSWEDLTWKFQNFGIDYEDLDQLKWKLHSNIKTMGKEINKNKLSLIVNNNIDYASKQKNITHDIKLQIMNDRSIYPRNAIIYVRVILNDLIVDKKISFVLSDTQRNVILEKNVEPASYMLDELDGNKIFEIKFMLNDPKWKKKKSYELKATYGNAEDTCNFTTDIFPPIIQTDKSSYMFYDDMIITVIDPNENKDSNETENIGDRPNSLLTISCGNNKIVGYKLRETGDSTGIFQGIIGIIGNYEGEILGYQLEDKIITKTQGNGPHDGFIQVSYNERINIEYYDGKKTIKLKTHSNNFGAIVTLDQKVYSWRDTVYITILAPNFNRDNEKCDIIGNKKENNIVISTSKKTISGFKMHETGTDTGIFTGEVKLTGFSHKMNGAVLNDTSETAKILNDTDMFPTSRNDEIKISFSCYGEKIEAIAIIRWNIGEIMWGEKTYQIGNSGKITVIDPDMSITHHAKNKFKIKIYSDSDKHGMEIVVTETNISTGVFEGTVIFSDVTMKNHSINVKKGDNVYAQYIDFTLPDPYNIDDMLEIVSKCKIKK